MLHGDLKLEEVKQITTYIKMTTTKTRERVIMSLC